MSKKVPITVAHGGGIGPEIMAGTLHSLEAGDAALEHGHLRYFDGVAGFSLAQGQ